MALPAEICDISEVVTLLALGSSLTSADRALLTMLKGYVEDDMRAFVMHNITQPSSDYVHYLPGKSRNVDNEPLFSYRDLNLPWMPQLPAGDELQLPQPFVRSITSIYEDEAAYGNFASGAFAADTLLTAGTDYFLDVDETGLCASGIIYRIGAPWSNFPRSIKVTYMAGFTATELDQQYRDIKRVAVTETVTRFKASKARSGADGTGLYPIRAERLGGEYSVTYDTQSRQVAMNSLSEDAMECLEPYMYMAMQ